MARLSRALVFLVPALITACDMGESTGGGQESIISSSLTGQGCDGVDGPDEAHCTRYVDCAANGHQDSCKAEKACLDVAKRRLKSKCHAQWHISEDWHAAVEHCHKLCTGEPIDLEACAAEVPPRSDLSGREREIAYQAESVATAGHQGFRRARAFSSHAPTSITQRRRRR